jgi:O-antigen ligase
MVAARPVFGFGWGRFLPESGPYYKQAETYPLTIVPALHSVFLSNAVELGLVGALLWAAALLMAVGGAVFRRAPPELEPWRLGLLAYASCWLVVSNFTPLGYTFSNYLLWTWAGLLGAATVRRSAA